MIARRNDPNDDFCLTFIRNICPDFNGCSCDHDHHKVIAEHIQMQGGIIKLQAQMIEEFKYRLEAAGIKAD